MIKLFVQSHCIGSKKGEDFLKKLDIPYEKINLTYQPLFEDDVYEMTRLSNGLDQIINYNSEEFDKNPGLKDWLSKATKKEAISYILTNPNVLSYPIVMQTDNNKTPKVLMIGFDDKEWEKLEKDPGFFDYFINLNEKYIFKTCCIYDEVLKDEINLLVNTDRKSTNAK